MLGTHDSVFAGANNHGKIYKSNGVNDFQLIKEQNDVGSIKSLVVDTIGTIFAGSDNGNIYQINSGSMYSKILNTGHEIKRLIIDRDGVLFAGVDSNQIYKKVKKSSIFCNMLGIDNDNEHILALTINSENILYAAGTEGILYSNKNFK